MGLYPKFKIVHSSSKTLSHENEKFTFMGLLQNASMDRIQYFFTNYMCMEGEENSLLIATLKDFS